MKFRDYFSKKQFLFALLIFAILIPIAIWDSGTQVRVTFDRESLFIKSDLYTMSVPYDIIVSAELTDLPEAGEKVDDGYDNDIIRTGCWKNDVWGEYYITADLDVSNCIVLRLDDGRVFVFNAKSNKKTSEHYETLQTYLNTAN